MSSISPLLSDISPWIAGVVGGLAANIAANLLWRNITKPKLRFKKTTETDFEVNGNGEPESRRFKILVHNDGRTAAKNCKPKIRLQGRHEQSIYEVDITVCWAESGSPSRITINPDETAAFEFFKITSEDGENGVLKTEKSFYVRFPKSAAEKATMDIVEWHYDEDFEKVEGATFHDEISKELFEEICWEDNEVIVTSENTNRIDGYIILESDIEDAQGLVGLNANVIPK